MNIVANKDMLVAMALTGWQLKKLSGSDFSFERIEPQKLIYSVIAI